MGCAASLNTENTSRIKKREKNGTRARKAQKRRSPGGPTPQQSLTVAGENPLTMPPTSKKSSRRHHHSRYASVVENDAGAERSSELSSISDDLALESHGSTSHNTGSGETRSPGTTPRTLGRTKSGSRTIKSLDRSRDSRLSSLASSSQSMMLDAEPKWKRQVAVKRINLFVKRSEGPDSISPSKLARIQRWIDYSDQGTSPLGRLLDPKDVEGQSAREVKLRELVQQGIPVYAQANSVDRPTVPSAQPARRVVVQRVPSTKIKSRIASALAKAKRRQSHAVGPEDALMQDGVFRSSDSDGQPGTAPMSMEASENVPLTGSMANVPEVHETMSHVFLEER